MDSSPKDFWYSDSDLAWKNGTFQFAFEKYVPKHVILNYDTSCSVTINLAFVVASFDLLLWDERKEYKILKDRGIHFIGSTYVQALWTEHLDPVEYDHN